MASLKDPKYIVSVTILVGCMVGAHFLKDDPLMHSILLAVGGVQGLVNMLLQSPFPPKESP